MLSNLPYFTKFMVHYCYKKKTENMVARFLTFSLIFNIFCNYPNYMTHMSLKGHKKTGL